MAGSGEVAHTRPFYRGAMARPHVRALAETAALARIKEVSMTTKLSDATAAARSMWALGDYHRFATELVWEVGPVVVDACRIGSGDRVLDVAAGTGNVAIRAAEAGASVVASDLTPENFAAGRREAAARGVELEWVEADAEALPFRDGEFDIVTSAFGAIFAPDQGAVADELVRVCRAGGTIGMANFAGRGTAGRFFELVAEFAPPPPPGAHPPVLWGDEEHVRELFGDRVSLELTRKEYVERSPGGPAEYRDFFKTTFGPLVALYGALEASAPERAQALDRAFLEFAMTHNRGTPDAAEYVYEYLLVVARKR
jgi:ubiquinone/menaquinone biosynthesis C-methylase UbiE